MSTTRNIVELPAGGTILDILDAAGVDVPALANAHLFIDDWYVPRAKWHCVRPRPGRTIALSIVPGGGGGGKNPLRVILQIALIAAVAAFAGPLGATFATQFGVTATVGTALAGAAIGLAGSLLINAIAPPAAPKFDRLSAERDSPTYSIAGGSNALRPWGPVPLLLGQHRVFPPYAAQPYTEVEGDDQFWRALFLIGYGPVAIEELKIGETPIEDFQDVAVEIREGYPTDPPRALFT
ncbi:MAG: phage tail protein, partial [Inquilinus sp.]|nr:phage tail protein [Inquilinus sp.]